jgi:molybdate transport system regulatory protein
MKVRHPQKLGARLRIVLGPEVAIGPGKADLLDGIRETGSIAASGRRMDMSYKRAWLLVEAMNEQFKGPLVVKEKGGVPVGGARLTDLGARVLALYRRMQLRAEVAIGPQLDELQELLSARRVRPHAKVGTRSKNTRRRTR